MIEYALAARKIHKCERRINALTLNVKRGHYVRATACVVELVAGHRLVIDALEIQELTGFERGAFNLC